MKRALITFGNSFGLALYDSELRGVRGGGRRIPDRRAVSWVVLAPDGRVLATYTDPVDFCAALRRQLEEVEDPRALKALWARHAAALEMLRCNLPELISDGGIHWAQVLLGLYSQRREVIHERAGTQQASASTNLPSGNSTDNPIRETPEPRRVRDKEHLRFVASLPCLVCGRGLVAEGDVGDRERITVGREDKLAIQLLGAADLGAIDARPALAVERVIGAEALGRD